MFRDDFNPYVSERRAQAWWPPPFDVPETIKQLEIWRKTSNVQLFGAVKDGRRWHRSAGEEFLADYESVVMAWVSRKLDSRASLTTKSVFASPLRSSSRRIVRGRRPVGRRNTFDGSGAVCAGSVW